MKKAVRQNRTAKTFRRKKRLGWMTQAALILFRRCGRFSFGFRRESDEAFAIHQNIDAVAALVFEGAANRHEAVFAFFVKIKSRKMCRFVFVGHLDLSLFALPFRGRPPPPETGHAILQKEFF